MHHKNYWWSHLPCYLRSVRHAPKTIDSWKHEFQHINRHIDELYNEILELISKRDEIISKVNSNLDAKIKMLQDMKIFLDKEKCNTYTVHKEDHHCKTNKHADNL